KPNARSVCALEILALMANLTLMSIGSGPVRGRRHAQQTIAALIRISEKRHPTVSPHRAGHSRPPSGCANDPAMPGELLGVQVNKVVKKCLRGHLRAAPHL